MAKAKTTKTNVAKLAEADKKQSVVSEPSEVLAQDIDERMKALNEDHKKMGAR